MSLKRVTLAIKKEICTYNYLVKLLFNVKLIATDFFWGGGGEKKSAYNLPK